MKFLVEITKTNTQQNIKEAKLVEETETYLKINLKLKEKKKHSQLIESIINSNL